MEIPDPWLRPGDLPTSVNRNHARPRPHRYQNKAIEADVCGVCTYIRSRRPPCIVRRTRSLTSLWWRALRGTHMTRGGLWGRQCARLSAKTSRSQCLRTPVWSERGVRYERRAAAKSRWWEGRRCRSWSVVVIRRGRADASTLRLRRILDGDVGGGRTRILHCIQPRLQSQPVEAG